VVKEKQAVDLVDAIWTNRANEQPDTLLRTIDILTSHSEQFTKSQIARANDLLDQLAKEVEPATLSVPGVELSIADIDSLRVDVAVALDDPALELQAYSRVVASYKELIQKFKAQNSRGYNLELAYALWKSGKVDEAKAIYERFIVLYPKEFTFYYAAAKMYLDLKILPTARDYAEKAVKFAYGDNKLRSMERLMRVMIAQGENSEALKRGREFFQEVGTVSSDLFVRTNRYVQAFKKALDEVQKENHK
jgi:tetratricopeptide (TPR) repeat protein